MDCRLAAICNRPFFGLSLTANEEITMIFLNNFYFVAILTIKIVLTI